MRASVCFDSLFNFFLEFVDALADILLVWSGRGLQPKIVELSEDAVLARHPAIAISLPGILVGSISCSKATAADSWLQSRQKFARGAIEGRGREVGKFGNCVRHVASSNLNEGCHPDEPRCFLSAQASRSFASLRMTNVLRTGNRELMTES